MRTALFLLLAVLLAGPVSAQEQFKHVWVTQSDSGELIRGRMVDLSGESLAILTADNRRVEIPLSRVLRIEAHGDSLKNGAAIGAAVMGALSIFACQGVSRGSQCVAGSIINIGLGSLIGAGVDALNGGRSTLYSRPAAGKTAAVNVRVRF